LYYLKENDPKCNVTFVAFGSSVTIFGHDGSKTDVPSHLFSRMEQLVDFGRRYSETHAFVGVDASFACHEQTVRSLSPNGGTPLGPAISLSVGIASRLPGSRVMVFTDGIANIGIGLLTKVGDKYVDRSGFYSQVGDKAAQCGVTISVVTVADEDCSLENLGIAAERSSGSVDIVDPEEVSSAMASFLQRKTLGTKGVLSVFANPKLAKVTVSSSPPTDDATPQKWKTSVDLPVIDEKTDVAFFVEPLDSGTEWVDLQFQLRYFTPSNDEMLVMQTKRVPIVRDRGDVEQCVDSAVVSIASIRRASALASLYHYMDARVLLISVQRLLQRTLKSEKNQRDYLSFIYQAEKLDQFMRESQRMEAVFGKAANRDDGAAKSIFSMKSLCVSDFEKRI
jgi:hypothetical protein